MNKFIYIFIVFFLCSLVCLHGQELLVQSNNASDLKQYEQLTQATDINALKTKLEKVIKENPDYSNTKILIQITFLDPYALGGLKLKSPHIHSGDYVNIWKTAYTAEDRILFLFEKNDKQYIFKDFAVTQSIEDGQIPDLVVNYIKAQILKSENNDAAKIVYKGLNAVKNAYDRSFQNAMINSNRIQNMLAQKKYYKGYNNFAWAVPWFNFERILNTNKQPYDMEKLYEMRERPGLSMEYVEVPVQSVKSMQENKDRLFVAKYGLSVGQTELATLKESIYFEDANLLPNSDPSKLYTLGKDSILSNIFVFKKWEYQKINSQKKLVFTFEPEEKALSQKYKIKVVQGEILFEDKIDEYNGHSQWGPSRFSYNQPTWCNKFARDLTCQSYGNEGCILNDKSAEVMNIDFNSKKDKYMELSKDIDGSIWKMYINKGYLVFFSDKGHIEVGFPDNKHYLDMKTRHSDDSRYPNAKTSNDTRKTTILTIGAGSTVGYKLANDWAINPQYNAQPFIYLEYLNIEN